MNYFTNTNLLGNHEADIGAATPMGSGCNLTAIDFQDFLNITGTTFCQNPSTVVPTSVPANLNVAGTGAVLFSEEPNPFLEQAGFGRRLLSKSPNGWL